MAIKNKITHPAKKDADIGNIPNSIPEENPAEDINVETDSESSRNDIENETSVSPNNSNDSVIEIEIDGNWVSSLDTGFGTFITGIRCKGETFKIKTCDGWFDESDPNKNPILFIEIPNDSIFMSVHVRGGEWLPSQSGKVGCGVPIDAISYSK